jgi:hypothetical protein
MTGNGEPRIAVVAAGAITVLSRRCGLPEAAGDLGTYYDPDDEAGFNRALNAARRRSERHAQSPSARRSYNRRIAAHVAKFRPETVVENILREMSS